MLQLEPANMAASDVVTLKFDSGDDVEFPRNVLMLR